jgi:Protein of unknown function (DUF429)
MRATDMYIQERALTPFSVSADRIGAVAMRCSLLLSRLAEREGKAVDRVNGRVVECYPSAALYRFGFSRAELRGAKTDSDVRARLLDEILARTVGWLQLGSEEKEDLVAVGDVFDAFLATLVARAAALGLTDQPPPHLATLARSPRGLDTSASRRRTRSTRSRRVSAQTRSRETETASPPVRR